MRRLLRDQRGQATVEFAVCLPIFLLLILGVIYFGKAFYKEQQVHIAVRYVAWKAGRHDPGHNFTAAANTARMAYTLDGASISGQTENGTVEDLSDFGADLFLGFGDPSALPSIFSFSTSQIMAMLGSGIAPVDTRASAIVSQPMGTSMLSFIPAYNIERGHWVDIGHWDYEEIHADIIWYAYEAYLDVWAYNEITDLCDWCI